MIRQFHKLFRDDFWRHNAIFFIGSIGISFLNYLFYPVLGHLMPPSEFGEVQAIIAIFTQAAVFLQVLGFISVGVIAKYKTEPERDRVIFELSRASMWLSLVMFGLTILFSPLFKSFFHFNSIAPFIALGISLLVAVPLSFASAYLHGHKRFSTLSTNGIILSVTKLVASAFLVVLGLHTLGVIAGLIISQCIGLAYALSKGQGIARFVKANLSLRQPNFDLIRAELPYAALVFVTAITINLFLSLDIIVVKHYFTPTQAGLYSGISITANILYFLTGPLAAVLLPSVKPSQSNATNQRLLWRSLALCTAIGGSALAIFTFLPRLVITVLLGSRYTPFAGYLPGLSVALFLLSIANLLIFYHLALRHLLVAPVITTALLITGWLLNNSHATMGAVVTDLIIGAVVLLTLLTGVSTLGQKALV